MTLWRAFAFFIIAPHAAGDQKQGDALTTAQTFLESLDRDQHHRALLPFEDDDRTHWRYVPAVRKGVAWKELDQDQGAKATALLKSSLSDLGYSRVETVRRLEAVLADMERNPRGRDKDNYLFTFFGAPSATSKWAWRYEGHHVSLNFTYDGARLVASTPQFFGSNPATVLDGPEKGLRMLSKEEDAGFALLGTLDAAQRAKALLSPTAPGDIFTSMDRKAAKIDDRGLPYTEMSSAQQTQLMGLIKTYAQAQKPDEAERRLKKIGEADVAKILFAWMGGERPGEGHYYRIQGPTFLIEFDNTQNRANHIHSVWRDFEGDFGRDVLSEHYSEHHRHGTGTHGR